MLIYIKGSDSLLAKTAIDQIKQKYLEKNPDGVELVEIDQTTLAPDWVDLQAIPLFATTRLVVVRRLGSIDRTSQTKLAASLPGLSESTVLVVWDGRKIDDSELGALLQAAAKIIAVDTPTGLQLSAWVKKRAKQLEVTLAPEELERMVQSQSGDLWMVETELRQLITGTGSSGRKRVNEPFIFFSLIRRNDWGGVKQELKHKFLSGEPPELVIGSLAAAVRKEVRDKSRSRVLVELMLDIDVGLKTGLLDPDSAGSLLVANLPQPHPNRIQWEQVWEATVS